MTAHLGTVLERDGSIYRVAGELGELRAVLRGKAKRTIARGSERGSDRGSERVVVGDRVRLELESELEAEGALYGIVGVEPRRTLLERRVPEGRGSRPVAANIDQVLVVTAAADPAPVPQLIDRLLVVAEANSIPASVIINKIDLDAGLALSERFRAAGYEVFSTSVRTGEGIAALAAALAGRTSVVTGPSGAGKSSLLNAVQPGLKLRVGELSQKVRRGKHTTVSAVMIPLHAGGFLVDTPGFSEVGLWGIEPRELASCFPEIRPYIGECKYQDCRHMSEPHCAVQLAVEEGRIAPDRLRSYRMLLAELEGAPADWE